MAPQARGHLFVVMADMLGLDCDAVLLPTDPEFHFRRHWWDHLEAAGGSARSSGAAWEPGEAARVLVPQSTDGPALIAACVAPPFDVAVPVAQAVADATHAAVEYVRVASQHVVPAPHRSSAPARVALPMVGTGGSGLSGWTGLLVEQLVDGLIAAASATGIDVVLCVIDELQWSAVQAVRASMDVSAQWALPERLLDEAQRVADHARSKDLVLFMGAGVGRDAGLPDWDELLAWLSGQAGLSASETAEIAQLDPRDRARLLERRLDGGGGQALRAAIAERLGADRFGLSHALLASLDVPAAVTTNFDSLYERAAELPERSERRPRRLPYEPVTGSSSWLLKLHGDAAEGDVVITRSDYLGLARHRSALFGVVQALLLTRHLLFVGYSMSDDDFHALVDEIDSALGAGAAHHLGTALVLESSMASRLWEDVVDVTVVDPGHHTSPERGLLILLDRAACLAADHARHLLDQSFEGLLTPEERLVAARLREVLDRADASVTAPAVRAALGDVRRRLGG